MTVMTYANSPLLLWPEILMIALGVSYLIGWKFGSRRSPDEANRVRTLSFVGFLSTASAVLLVSTPSYYTLVTIPLIPGLFIFAALIFRPNLLKKQSNLESYLAICAAISTLVWCAQFVRLLRG